jgi:hypothetical protein
LILFVLASRSSDGGANPRSLHEHALRVEGYFFRLANLVYAAGSFHLRQQRLGDP